MDKLNKFEVPFTMVSNELLNSDTISLKAKGLYSYMFSKPDGWNFTTRSMAKQLKEGREAIMAGLNELKEAKYLEYKKKKDGTGIYTLYTSPYIVENEPKSENPTVGKSQSRKTPPWENPTVGKPDHISNTDLSSNTDLTNTTHTKKENKNFIRVSQMLLDEYYLEQTAMTFITEVEVVKKELAEFIKLAELESRFESTQFNHQDFMHHFHNTLRIILEKKKKVAPKKKKETKQNNELSPAQEAHQGAGERAASVPILRKGIDF